VRLNQWTILLSVILTWVTGVFWILAIPLVANILGILCNFNPIIRVGKLFLKSAPSTYIPEDAQQQKFNFFQQKSPPSIGSEMNAGLSYLQRVSKHPLKEIKASGGCHGNRKGVLCASTKPIPDAIMPRHN